MPNRIPLKSFLLAAGVVMSIGGLHRSMADPAASVSPAFRADQFTDFIGLSASPFETYLDSGPFKGAGTKYPPDTFFDLGVRHYRTGLLNALTMPNAPALIGAAYEKYGAQAMLLVNGGKNASPKDVVSRLKLYEPGSVDLVEGPNEVNNKFPPQNLNIEYQGKTDEAGGAAFMDDLYKLIKTDPATRNIGVVSFTAIFTDYHLARPCDSFDFSNMHSYQGYNVPSSSIAPNETSFDNILPSGGAIKPFVPTECGYNVQADVSNGTNNTGSLRAQALNIPMLLAEYFRHGIKRAYLFALHNADGYGLLESDQTTKRPSYFAVKNLLATIKDSSWNGKTHQWVGGDFTPRALLFHMEGAPSTVHTLTLQKHDGQYVLLIWNEVQNFDQNTHKDIVNAPVPVTLTINTPISSTARILTQNDAGGYDAQSVPLHNGELPVQVPAAVTIVELTPKADHKATALAAPRNITGTSTTSSIHVAWQPSTQAVSGYFVFRNGEFITSTKTPFFDDNASVIRPGLGYEYGVQSFDSSGNMSPRATAVIVTPDRRPDLICSEVDVPTVKSGDSVAFRGVIKNIGDGPTPNDTVTGLTFFIDGQYTSYATTDGTPLAPGESRVLTANGGKNNGHWTAVAGAHLLHVQVDDIDRVSDESNKENNNVDRSLLVDVNTPGLLLGAGAPAPGQVDLTAEGTSDWIQWGLGAGGFDKTGVNRKAGQHQIGDLTNVGTGYTDATPGFGMSVRWSDGSPIAAENDTHASLWLNGVGHGYQFSAPADTAERVLKVYVGAINGAEGTLTAHLSDGSAPDYVSNTFNGNRSFAWSPVPAGFTTVYTLRYHAGSPNQKLIVTWTLSNEPNQFAGQARLQAATLALGDR